MKIVQDIEAKEDILHGEVSAVTMMRKNEEEPCKLREFMLDKLQNDYFFKAQAMEKAS